MMGNKHSTKNSVTSSDLNALNVQQNTNNPPTNNDTDNKIDVHIKSRRKGRSSVGSMQNNRCVIVCYGYIRNIESRLLISSKFSNKTIPKEIYNLCFEYYHSQNILFYVEKDDNNPNIIYLKTSYGKYLSMSPYNYIHANANGPKNIYSKWVAVYYNDKTTIKLRNCFNNRYLRIYNNFSDNKNNHYADIGGGGGDWTKFKIHQNKQHNQNMISLESIKCPSMYITVNIYNKYNIHPMHINTTTTSNANQYSYMALIKSGIIVIKYNNKKQYVAIKQNDQDNVCSNYNNIDSFSKWWIEIFSGNKIKFKNRHSGKYLRIINRTVVNVKGTGGHFTVFKYNLAHKTLESNRFPGYYLAVKKYINKLCAITKSQNNGEYDIKFDFKYLDNDDTKIVFIKNIKSSHYMLSCKNNMLQIDVSKHLNKNDKCYQWQYEKYFDGKVIKLKNIYNNKYLRLWNHNNTNNSKTVNCIDINGGGGKWTFFQYDIKNKTFQSKEFQNRYLSVKEYNGTGYVITSVGVNEIDDNSRFDLIEY